MSIDNRLKNKIVCTIYLTCIYKVGGKYNMQNWIAGPQILEGRITGSPHGLSTLRPDLGPPVTHRLATRPPLAGPYAFSRIPPPVWNKPRVFLMHDILNTWLFTNFSSGYLFRMLYVYFLVYVHALHVCALYLQDAIVVAITFCNICK